MSSKWKQIGRWTQCDAPLWKHVEAPVYITGRRERRGGLTYAIYVWTPQGRDQICRTVGKAKSLQEAKATVEGILNCRKAKART